MTDKIIEHNCTTNKTIVRNYTDKEQKIRDAEIIEANKVSAIKAKIEETKAKNKASAITKLKTLGLLDNEITALIGE